MASVYENGLRLRDWLCDIYLVITYLVIISFIKFPLFSFLPKNSKKSGFRGKVMVIRRKISAFPKKHFEVKLSKSEKVMIMRRKIRIIRGKTKKRGFREIFY